MAVLRRRHSRQDRPIRVGELVVDPERRKVLVGDREVHLAKKEFTATSGSSGVIPTCRSAGRS